MFCECVQASIWNPEKFLEAESGVYYMWAHQQKVWYVGKANISGGEAGMVRRFKEHMILSFKNTESTGFEKRYLTWRGVPKHTMCFIPIVWGSEGEILDYERHLINTLQAPMQDRVKPGAFRVARKRDWKRFRTKPTLEHEI